MTTYEYQMRRRKRGDWCLINKCSTGIHGYCPQGNSLCGCGSRCPPSREYQNRVIRRLLQRELAEVVEELE